VILAQQDLVNRAGGGTALLETPPLSKWTRQQGFSTKLKTMFTIQGNRRRLSSLENCEFIEPEDFLSRATSRQALLRADDAAAAVHGLLDPRTGQRFFVEYEKLERWQQLPR